MGSEKFIEKAKDIVYDYAIRRLDITDKIIEPEVYVVLYSYVLGSQKALLSTTLPDGMYYEVTYNAEKKEIYLDAYKKFENVCIKVGE